MFSSLLSLLPFFYFFLSFFSWLTLSSPTLSYYSFLFSRLSLVSFGSRVFISVVVVASENKFLCPQEDSVGT